MLVAIPGAGGGGGRCFPLEACLCVQPDDWFGVQEVETRMTQLSNSLHPSSLSTSLHYLHASFVLWYLLSASTAYHRMRVYFKQVRRGIF